MPSCNRLLTGAVATIMLTACGSDAGVGGVTGSEADALNEAAATLDARSSAAASPATGLNPAAIAARNRQRDIGADDAATE